MLHRGQAQDCEGVYYESTSQEAMHKERHGPFFKEKYVDDEAVLEILVINLPSLNRQLCTRMPSPYLTKPPLPPPPPPPPPSQRQQPTPKQRHSLTFEEEFDIVLREKNYAELKEMEESGRMKQWTPMSKDYSSMPSVSAQRLRSERKGTGSQVVGDFVRLSRRSQVVAVYKLLLF